MKESECTGIHAEPPHPKKALAADSPEEGVFDVVDDA